MTSHYFEHTHVSDGQRNSREVTEERHRQIDAVAHINVMSVSQRTLARLVFRVEEITDGGHEPRQDEQGADRHDDVDDGGLGPYH